MKRKSCSFFVHNKREKKRKSFINSIMCSKRKKRGNKNKNKAISLKVHVTGIFANLICVFVYFSWFVP